MPSIWSVTVAPGKSIKIPSDRALQLSHATLLIEPKPGRTVLQVQVKGNAYALCTLQRDLIETQRLTHFFHPDDMASFIVTGPNSVQVIGNLIKIEKPGFEAAEKNNALSLLQPEDIPSSDEEEYVLEDDKKRKVSFHLLNDMAEDSDDEEDEDYTTDNSDEEDGDYMDTSDRSSEEEKEEDAERETISGEPRYASYLSDLLGPDLPDEEDEDFEFEQMADDYGTLAFRDASDNEFLGGFELRHFNLVPNYPGFEKVDLREQEESIEDSLLNDNIAAGLVNALLNSGDHIQIRQGKELLKRLKKQSKARRNM